MMFCLKKACIRLRPKPVPVTQTVAPYPIYKKCSFVRMKGGKSGNIFGARR